MADEENSEELRIFVVEEYEAQAAEYSLSYGAGDPVVDVDRMNRFYERALNESERMSNEVTKSHVQRMELHKELGADMFESWTHDHAQQVLSAQRYNLWSKEEEKAKKALQQLQETTNCDDNGSDDDEK